MRRVGIIGFGFSGSMVLANLVRRAREQLEMYVIDPAPDARGLAYATPYAAHLLNVRAANMGAWADDAGDFLRWLNDTDAPYGAHDFAPRRLYGDYLESIWQQTQALAAQKQCAIKLVPSRAVAITKEGDGLRLMTERGDAIALDAAVLATGNEVKPIAPPLADVPVLQNPWAPGALQEAAQGAGPVLLVGTGLTAVDMVLALRMEGYAGRIIAMSRGGLMPQPHRDDSVPLTIASAEVPVGDLRALLHWLRKKSAGAADWRSVVDALRPHTQSIWAKLPLPQQQRVLRRLASYWNVHRHRMAPQIAAAIAQERVAGSLRLMTAQQLATLEGKPTQAINCTGPELRVEKARSRC